LCGPVVGAAVVARNQLERWLLHRAHRVGLDQEEGETILDFIARPWGAEALTQHFSDLDAEAEATDEADENSSDGTTVAAEVEQVVPPVRSSQVTSTRTGADTDGAGEEGAALDHGHVLTSDGRVICPPLLYITLSEMMHGRGVPEALRWDSSGLLQQNHPGEDMAMAVGSITDSITLSLREVRMAVRSLAAERGHGDSVAGLVLDLDTFSMLGDVSARDDDANGDHGESPHQSTGDVRDEVEDHVGDGRPAPRYRLEFDSRTGRVRPPDLPAPEPPRLAAPPLQSLMPLMPQEGLAPEIVAYVEHMASTFTDTATGKRPAGRLWRDDELTTYAFAWHRARSARAAQRAMDREMEMLGEEFDPARLTSRGTRWTLLCESASLLGIWDSRPETADAAALIGSALRSAYWLWLEDDDRAMAVLRCVFEQVARMRTWRLKPTKAGLLESREQTMPRDWIEGAGWRRLNPLNRALGEFAHTRATSRWTGARELLSSLQPDVVEDDGIYTARGAALDFVSALVAREVHARIAGLSPVLAATLAELFTDFGFDPTLSSKSVEKQFDHIWAQRTRSLGLSDFVPSAPGASTGPTMTSTNLDRLIDKLSRSKPHKRPAGANAFVKPTQPVAPNSWARRRGTFGDGG
jgi:hypothetical protein